MSLLRSAARAPLDLSAAEISQPEPHCLIALSTKPTFVWVLAGIFAAVAVFGVYQAWRASSRRNGWI